MAEKDRQTIKDAEREVDRQRKNEKDRDTHTERQRKMTDRL
jgi:hypothetical protein